MKKTIATMALALTTAISLHTVPAAAETISSKTRVDGRLANCASAHIKNRRELVAKARLECSNRAGKVKLRNISDRDYNATGCDRRVGQFAEARGSLTFACN